MTKHRWLAPTTVLVSLGVIAAACGGDNKSVTALHSHAVWFLLVYHAPGTSVPVTVRRGARTIAANLVIGPPDE